MDYIILSIPVFFILIGLELIISRLGKSQLYNFHDTISNISCGIASQLTDVLLKTLLVVMFVFIYDHYKIWEIPNNWITYILLFIGIDFFYYWFHRWSHEISLLWGAHIVHHQSEEYNFSVALRQSSIQGFFSMFFYLPLAFIGFNPVAFLTINAFQTLYQFWIHTKTINRLPRWIEYLFNTPSHHRVHHGRNPKYIDKNHGGTLIIFDRLFNSFQAEEEEVVYGVTKPLANWNPIWANFDWYADIWNDIKKPIGWKNRMRILFNEPGWRPHELGGPQHPVDITPEEVQKYNTILPSSAHIYLLLQYLLILGFTSYFLFQLAELSRIEQLVAGAFVALSILSISNLSNIWKFSVELEFLRLLLFVPLLYLIFNSVSYVYIIGAVLVILSVIHLARLVPQFKKGVIIPARLEAN